jgi:MEMO1 family protein
MTVDEALRSGQLGLLEAALRRVSYESTHPTAAGQQALQTLHDFKQNLLQAVRESALSATFFVADAEQLASSVDQCLQKNLPTNLSTLSVDLAAVNSAPPKIIIVPHAGHVYSGATAGKAYALLAPHAAKIRRVVLLGPAHRVYFQGIALPGAGSFATPLGRMPLDTLGLDSIADLPFISTRPDAHAQEHSLEVHVPFLQRALPHASLVPLLVGDAPREAVAQVMQRLWSDAETVFVISTDLSHFHPYEEANAIDAASCAKILALDASLNHQQACGATPVNGALLMAQERGLRITHIERLNSGDTAGNSPEGRQRVVGYASFALHESASDAEFAINSIANYADNITGRSQLGIKNSVLQDNPQHTSHPVIRSATRSANLTPAQGQQLVKLARQQLQQHIAGAAPSPMDLSDFQTLGASFVTLTQQGQLRGCIGSLQAHRALAQDVLANALAAALQDPRFPPVSALELAHIKVEVSVLTVPTALRHANESHALWQLRPGIDGLIFEAQHHGQLYRSTYLPQVWEQIPEPRAFLAHLKVKAGLSFDFWSPEVNLSRYQVQKFHE